MEINSEALFSFLWAKQMPLEGERDITFLSPFRRAIYISPFHPLHDERNCRSNLTKHLRECAVKSFARSFTERMQTFAILSFIFSRERQESDRSLDWSRRVANDTEHFCLKDDTL